LLEHLGLLHDPEEASDRGAEDDPDARRVEAVQVGVFLRLDRGGECEQDVPIEAPRFFRRDEAVRLERLHLGGDAHRELARVERLDEVDAALSRDRGAPGRRRVVAERSNSAEARDGDSPHSG
jgi:hypothetical protein